MNILHQWVIVTVATNGVVHTWGPYATKREAANARARFKRTHQRNWPDGHPDGHTVRFLVKQIRERSR